MSRLFLAALLALALLGARAEASCFGQMERDTFNSLLQRDAASVAIEWPDGSFPLGQPLRILFRDAGQEGLEYRAFGARPSSDFAPTRLAIRQVGETEDGETTIQVDLALDEHHAPQWYEVYFPLSIVVIACGPEQEAGTTPVQIGEYAYAATTEHIVSTRLGGWLGLTFAALVGYLALAAFACWLPFHRRSQSYPRLQHGLKSFFIDFRGRVSLSQLQVLFFFGVIFLSFSYVFGRTFQLSELSEDVLFLLGISAGGAVAGKFADTMKSRLDWENWAWLNFEMNAFPDVSPPPQWRQLVTTGGQFDIARFQALCFTLVVAPAVAFMSLYRLGELTIPDGVLAVLGLSQITYIAGKVATQPSMEDFNKRTTQMREAFRSGEPIARGNADSYAEEFKVAMEVAPKPGLADRLVAGRAQP